MNFVTGRLCDYFGRKPVLIGGWIVGIPGVLMVLGASNFETVACSNMFLGLNQSMAWSAVIYMLIDLYKSKAGLAVGAGETFGYTGAALANALMGDVVDSRHARTAPYAIEISLLVVAAIGSFLFVPETIGMVADGKMSRNGDAAMAIDGRDNAVVARDGETHKAVVTTPEGAKIRISMTSFVFFWTSAFNTSAAVTCLAGICINLSTSLVWGLIPEWLEDGTTWHALTVSQIAVVTLCNELPKGLFQIIFGIAGDRYGRKRFISLGLALSGIAVCAMAIVGASKSDSVYALFCVLSFLLGLGTAAMYTNCQAAVADMSRPQWRSTAVGTYRFWRDLGYVFGASLSGFLADNMGPAGAVGISGLVVFFVAMLFMYAFEEPSVENTAISSSSPKEMSTVQDVDNKTIARPSFSDDSDDKRGLLSSSSSSKTVESPSSSSQFSPFDDGVI